jgi:hypothetical protein
LLIQISFSIHEQNLGLDSTAVFEHPTTMNWPLLGLMASIIFVLQASVCYGSYKVISELDDTRRSLLGYFSLALLSTVYFQYFGNYVMFLLIEDSANFLIYTLASITLLIMAFLTFKLSFFIFMMRNIGHPNIRANGFWSPRGKFIFYWLFFVLINYIGSTVLVRYLSYSYYLIVVSSFPIVNIMENMCNGYKKHFSWYDLHLN